MDHVTAIPRGPGVIAGFKGLAKSAFGLLVSRLELAALELSEVRNHVIELMAVFVLATMCCWFALLFGCAVVVWLAWPAMGWTILALLFVLFGGAALALVMKGRAMLRQGKLALRDTMTELQHDREALL